MLAYHKGDRDAGEADRLLRAQVQVARYQLFVHNILRVTETLMNYYCKIFWK